MQDQLDKVRVVLVETQHPGNIGAAARAMKTMGLARLYLVNPRQFPNDEAEARASGATEVLAEARIVGSLREAVAECTLVAGASARPRKLAWPELDPRQCGETVMAASGECALVFGRERTGLTNAELDLCTHVVTIPANPDYASLNLAAAVQVLSYELRVAALAGRRPVREPEAPPATHEQLEQLYAHLQRVLADRGFLNPDNPEHLMRRLRRLYNRAGLDHNEVQILRGILTTLAPDIR